ncbi:MAG: DUF4962 domain-containing protein [Planctomycetota bacterium]|nr:DUF4962 domain-containing protein [Planctomycetota bacterium]
MRTLPAWCVLTVLAACGLPARAEEAPAPGGGPSLEYAAPRLPPIPEKLPLEEQTGHPRVYVPPGGVEELIERSKTTHKAIAETIAKRAEEILKEGCNPSPRNAESPMRHEVRKPAQMAWAYAATGDSKFKEAAMQYAELVCAYPHWDIDVDLAAGHALWSVSTVYDWFYKDLSEKQRTAIREKIQLQGNRMDRVWGKEHVKGGTWWTKAFLQNHGQENCQGLATAAIVFYHELPEAKEWLKHAEAHFETVFSILNEDGSSMEGINYWGYSMEHCMLYADLAQRNMGRDFFATSGYLRNAGRFLLAHMTPWIRPGDFAVSYGAASLSTGTHGPEHILFKAAAASRDPAVQDLAFTLLEQDVGRNSPLPPLALLWYDPTVPRGRYGANPTLSVFPELGIVSARSGWDAEATVLWFKCGAYQGRAATEVLKKDVGSGHARADQTAIQLISRGERLTAYGNSYCENHNLPLFRGVGQIGESGPSKESGLVVSAAFKMPEQPKLLNAKSAPAFDYFAGDASKAYRPEAGVKTYRRHVVFLKPDDVLLIDEIELEPAQPEAKTPDVSSNLQVLGEPKDVSPRHARADGQRAGLDVMLCAPAEGFALKASSPPPNTGYMMPEAYWERKRIGAESTQPVAKTVLVTYLHAREAGAESPEAPKVEVAEGKVRADVRTAQGARTIEVDLERAACEVK